jgi:hypothetical protein
MNTDVFSEKSVSQYVLAQKATGSKNGVTTICESA